MIYVLLNLDLIFSTYAGADNAKDMTPQMQYASFCYQTFVIIIRMVLSIYL